MFCQSYKAVLILNVEKSPLKRRFFGAVAAPRERYAGSIMLCAVFVNNDVLIQNYFLSAIYRNIRNFGTKYRCFASVITKI